MLFGDAVRRSVLFISAGERLLAGAIEPGTRRSYTTGLNRFREFLQATSARFEIAHPPCSSARDLRLLVEQKGTLEGFICFCSAKGLSSGSISGYVDGLKHFATDLDAVPNIANSAVLARMLAGQVKPSKRPGPRKNGITVDLLREMVVMVNCMDELSPVGKALLRAIFVMAYFGAFRISEYLISDDRLKLLSLDNFSLAQSGALAGAMRFVLYKTKNNSSGPFQEVFFPPIPDDVICPVAALQEYLRLRPKTESDVSFFLDLDGSPLVARSFNETLRSVLTRMSISHVELFSSKSFRIGAASDAFALNIPVTDIQALGRWQSEAFMWYIRSGARAVRAALVQRQLAAGRPKASHRV